MATNTTTSNSEPTQKDNKNLAIAVALPSLFAIILILLIAIRAFLIPKLSRQNNPQTREERKQQRMERLDSTVRAQHFSDWAAAHVRQDSDGPWTVNPICVICLDEIKDMSQIRGLGCLHVFHQECLDDWFARWNEFCPLCHQPIIPGSKVTKKKVNDPPPTAFIV